VLQSKPCIVFEDSASASSSLPSVSSTSFSRQRACDVETSTKYTVSKRENERAGALTRSWHVLWITMVCIDQHDKFQKLEHIRNLDWIYENTFLTIAAASSPSSDTGISGVSRPLLNVDQRTVETLIGPVMATFCRDVCEEYPHWPWSKRAWTLQEGVLSKRLLILTDQNYF
jgi:hypothetical protein